jgi:hypothetical protein
LIAHLDHLSFRNDFPRAQGGKARRTPNFCAERQELQAARIVRCSSTGSITWEIPNVFE